MAAADTQNRLDLKRLSIILTPFPHFRLDPLKLQATALNSFWALLFLLGYFRPWLPLSLHIEPEESV
jgi:hypothetical protein